VCETVFETSVMERKGKEKEPNLFFKRKRVLDFQFIEESIKKEDTASVLLSYCYEHHYFLTLFVERGKTNTD